MRVMVGDIGGTNARLRIAVRADGQWRVERERAYPSRRYDGLAPIVREFLAEGNEPAPRSACLAIAGPVRVGASHETVRVTNLPWEIDSRVLAQAIGFERVRLVNDFQAVGYGIEALDEQDLIVLQRGEPVAQGPCGVIGAGTGLGQAIMVWHGDHYHSISTEGGHAEFGPTDDLQLELARYLLEQEGHASYELILSGHGLARLYRFLRARGTTPESPAVARVIAEGDPAAAITNAAQRDRDPLALETIELFVRVYGAQAGNLALTAGATGGVYIAGGIAPKILSQLQSEGFIEAFRNKANMSHYVAAIPVRVVVNEAVGLLGAALVASRL
ncbi:MAG: glucokinase [Pseudomonadota bacterium]|nr:MAG: glucokinase [Pseudomonadota bacterium]